MIVRRVFEMCKRVDQTNGHFARGSKERGNWSIVTLKRRSMKKVSGKWENTVYKVLGSQGFRKVAQKSVDAKKGMLIRESRPQRGWSRGEVRLIVMAYAGHDLKTKVTKEGRRLRWKQKSGRWG